MNDSFSFSGCRQHDRRKCFHYHYRHRKLYIHLRCRVRDRQAGQEDTVVHKRRINGCHALLPRWILLREIDGHGRDVVRLAAVGQSDCVCGGLLARLRTHSLADDGRDSAREDPRFSREYRDRLQLDVHVHRNENLRGCHSDDRRARHLLAVRHYRRSRFLLCTDQRTGDERQVA